MTENRSDALARLDVFVGEWATEVRFPPGHPARPDGADKRSPARCRFEWTLDRQFLLQRTEVPIREAPDSLSIIGVDRPTGGYLQHYYDSRGVARLYAMTFTDDVWTLTRESPDFTPLDFRQRFVGTLSQDRDTITGAWELDQDGTGWRHDFAMIYRRVS